MQTLSWTSNLYVLLWPRGNFVLLLTSQTAEPEMKATKRSFSFSPKACCGCFSKKKSAPTGDDAEGADENAPRAEDEAPDAAPAPTAPAS